MLVAFAVDAMFRPCGSVLSPPVWLVSHISACLDLKLPSKLGACALILTIIVVRLPVGLPLLDVGLLCRKKIFKCN